MRSQRPQRSRDHRHLSRCSATRKPNGKVASVKRTEEPTRQTAAKGLNFGLVVGVVVALFPAAGIGLVAGMFRMVPPEPVSELSLATSLKAARSDLKNLGELLDNRTWARGRVPSTPRGRCPQPVQPVLVAAPSPGKGRHAKAGLETLNII